MSFLYGVALMVAGLTLFDMAVGAANARILRHPFLDALSWTGIALIAGAGIVVAIRSKTPPQIRGGGRS